MRNTFLVLLLSLCALVSFGQQNKVFAEIDSLIAIAQYDAAKQLVQTSLQNRDSKTKALLTNRLAEISILQGTQRQQQNKEGISHLLESVDVRERRYQFPRESIGAKSSLHNFVSYKQSDAGLCIKIVANGSYGGQCKSMGDVPTCVL